MPEKKDKSHVYEPNAVQWEQITNFQHEIVDELIRSRVIFEPFASGHEGYAVLLEEVEEVKEIVFSKVRRYSDEYYHDPEQLEGCGVRRIDELKNELVQVAAMALAMYLEV